MNMLSLLSRLVRIIVGIALLATGATYLTVSPSRAAVTTPADGLTAPTAAASCWEIKQSNPASASGVYWLVTPALVYPQQFYCDQDTDGGGWVMVGRGREGWKSGYNGIGTPQEINSSPVGQAAFKPAQLPALTVDALLNKTRVDALADGIRVRRAVDDGGSTWQEVRFKLTRRDRWIWTFDAEHPVGQYRFDASTGSGGQTANFGNNQATNRVMTAATASQNWFGGWAYGSSVTGQNSAGTYLWSSVNGRGNAIPFAQLFVRPQFKLSQLEFPVVPDQGSSSSTLSAIPDSNAVTTAWGVTGFANGSAGELNTEVAAFGEAAGRMYVGGNFRYVQRDEAGTGQIEQPYIAAFDVSSGQLISTFRPVLNGQVKAIAALPDGRIAVGGQFSSVNGQSHTALVFLDPVSGAVTGPQVNAENRVTGGVPYVRGLDVQANYLYVAGSFTHLTRVGATASASTWNGGRVNLSTGQPDTNWNASLNGSSISVDASSRGDRTYYSGYFKMKGTISAPSGVALQTAPGAPLTNPQWIPKFSKSGVDANGNITGNVWQLAVVESGNQVWLGGSEHSFFSYDRDTFERTSGNITKNGGDFQAATTGNGLVYAGCHCGDFVFQDAYSWSSIGNTWTQGDKMNLFGAWDASTRRYVAEFSPMIQARAGYGVWAIHVDSKGAVWAGGDLVRTVRSGSVNQWSGGFARFAPRDTTAPTKPGAITVNAPAGGSSATLTWDASTDNGGGVTYEVMRDGRVIDSTTSRTYTVPVPESTTKYHVRARDAAGNRSASTAAATVSPPSPTTLALVKDGSDWTWRFDTSPLPVDWASKGFDDSGWNVGAAPLGRGFSGAKTNIDPANLSPRPVSAQFRRKFNVTDALTVIDGKISVVANDGVVLYLNGTELGRSRMPAGTVTQNTYASAVVTQAAATASRITFDVPGGLLVNGENVIAASAHANYRSTPDLGFELSFVAERGEAPAAPAPVSNLKAEASSHDKVNLGWAQDGTGGPISSYQVRRNGESIGTVNAPTTTYSDEALTAATEYEYTVTAIGVGGSSSPSSVTVTTPAAPQAPKAVLDLSATATSYDAVKLSWVRDETGGATASYQVKRNGQNVGTVDAPATTYSDTALNAETEYEYTVTATGTGGSSPSASVSVTTPAAPGPEAKPIEIANQEEWTFRYTSDALPAAWNTVSFDDTSWAKGPGLLARGVSGAATNIDPAALSPRPLSAQFRKSFNVVEAGTVKDGTVTVIANDGVVLYLNGVELGRHRMPTGSLTQNTYATGAVTHASAAANRVTFVVPANLLVEGQNTIAASVHSNYRTTPDVSFHLALKMPR